MKPALVIGAALAASLGFAAMAAAQTGGFDDVGIGTLGLAIGSGQIGQSTAPPPAPPYHPTPGGGTSRIGPGYLMFGNGYQPTSGGGPLTVPGSPDPNFPQIPSVR
jgi:hypothetical protein